MSVDAKYFGVKETRAVGMVRGVQQIAKTRFTSLGAFLSGERLATIGTHTRRMPGTTVNALSCHCEALLRSSATVGVGGAFPIFPP